MAVADAERLLFFGLTSSDFYRAMGDGSSDVRWMMSKGLKLQWEYFFVHLINAATKHTFGLKLKASSNHPNLTRLIDEIRRTVRTVKEVEVVGDLFEDLCQLEGKRD